MKVLLLRSGALAAVVLPFIAVLHYPWATDDPIRREDALRDYYTMKYEGDVTVDRKNTDLAKAAGTAAVTQNIKGQVEWFVERFGLYGSKVLEVGSGTGYLQDVVQDYTGLDISPTAARYYHKPFVAGTATAMPFKDGEFDALWSIWVLEHIPNPEAALREIRRVVKPGGLLYLQPAWNVAPWAAQGYQARPYSDFGLGGKIVKASIPIRQSHAFWLVSTMPNRLVRAFASGPTQLHYRRLTPNYNEYWQADSDAVNHLDFMELARWFTSRGDECFNCNTGLSALWQTGPPLVIRRGQ